MPPAIIFDLLDNVSPPDNRKWESRPESVVKPFAVTRLRAALTGHAHRNILEFAALAGVAGRRAIHQRGPPPFAGRNRRIGGADEHALREPVQVIETLVAPRCRTLTVCRGAFVHAVIDERGTAELARRRRQLFVAALDRVGTGPYGGAVGRAVLSRRAFVIARLAHPGLIADGPVTTKPAWNPAPVVPAFTLAALGDAAPVVDALILADAPTVPGTVAAVLRRHAFAVLDLGIAGLAEVVQAFIGRLRTEVVVAVNARLALAAASAAAVVAALPGTVRLTALSIFGADVVDRALRPAIAALPVRPAFTSLAFLRTARAAVETAHQITFTGTA